jgi:hypothetical protein
MHGRSRERLNVTRQLLEFVLEHEHLEIMLPAKEDRELLAKAHRSVLAGLAGEIETKRKGKVWQAGARMRDVWFGEENRYGMPASESLPGRLRLLYQLAHHNYERWEGAQ